MPPARPARAPLIASAREQRTGRAQAGQTRRDRVQPDGAHLEPEHGAEQEQDAARCGQQRQQQPGVNAVAGEQTRQADRGGHRVALRIGAGGLHERAVHQPADQPERR